MSHITVGAVAACLGIVGLIVWWNTFGLVMRGIVPLGLVLFALAAVLSGYRRITAPRQAAKSNGAWREEDALREREIDERPSREL